MGDDAYGLCDVVDDDGAVGVAVVHGREGLVALLASRVPDLKLDCGGLVEGDGLGEECGADGGLPVVVKLILRGLAAETRVHTDLGHTLTNRSTSEDYVLLAPVLVA